MPDISSDATIPRIISELGRIQKQLDTMRSRAILGTTDSGWILGCDTWLYDSAESFKIAGKDVSALFEGGVKIRLKQGGAYKYFYSIGAVYGTDTVVSVAGGSDYTIANAAITDNYYSYSSNPQGFPEWFNYTPVFTGFSVDPTNIVSRFKIQGRTCTVLHREVTAGTSNSSSFFVTAPVEAATITNAVWGGAMFGADDNGIAFTTATKVIINSGASYFILYSNMASLGWNTANGKRANFMISYEISGYPVESPSMSPSFSMSPSGSQSPSGSKSPSASASRSMSPSGSASPSSSYSPSGSFSPSSSVSRSLSPSSSASPSSSGSSSASRSLSPSSSGSSSSSSSASRSASASPSPS